MAVDIVVKRWEDGIWYVSANIRIGENTMSGPHQIEGPEDMPDDDLKAAVEALYA